MLSRTFGRRASRYESSVANKGRIVIVSPGATIGRAAADWTAPAPKGTKDETPAKTNRAASKPQAPEQGAAPASSGPPRETIATKPESKDKIAKRPSVKVLQRRPDGAEREVPVHTPAEAADALAKMRDAIKANSPKD